MGFAPDGRWLLVLGHQGRGLFDCRTGVRVARVARDGWALLDDGGYAEAIGAVSGQRLRVAGLVSGGQLPSQSGRWSAMCDAGGVLRSGPLTQHLPETEGVRVVGFDPTGETFLLATSSTLHLYGLRSLAVPRGRRVSPQDGGGEY